MPNPFYSSTKSLSIAFLFSSLCVLLLLACDDQSVQANREDTAGDTAGDTTGGVEINLPPWVWSPADEVEIRVEVDPFELTLSHPHGPPVTFKEGSFGFGVVREINERLSYDPYWLHHEYLNQLPNPPPEFRWVFIQKLIRVEPLEEGDVEGDVIGERGWRLLVKLNDDTSAEMTLTLSSEDSLLITLTADDQVPAAYGYWEAPVRGEENFYGLGESFDHVARRGTYRSMNFQPRLTTESGYNEAHIPVPLLISTQGVSYFFETYQPSYFDVAYHDEEVVRAEQGRPHPMRLHLLWNAHPFDAIDTYYDLTSRPLVPPYWAFAPHYWRNVTSGQAEVESDLRRMRELKIPGGVFWIDRPYQNAYNDCQFDPNRYSNPASMTQTFSDLGYRMMLWHAPYTSEESDAWEEANEGGYFVQGPLFFQNFGKLMDFTHPDVVSLWSNLLDRFNTFNVSGYKLDYGEDVQIGVAGNRLFYSFYDGSDELTMHHKYATYYHRTYLNTLPPHPPRADGDQPHLVDGVILGRSSTFGGQQYTHLLWPGDLDSDFSLHLADDYWVGGLPAAVIGGLTLASSGFPFFASDTGGFRGERPTQEVLIRWAWQTAFSAVMQIGGGGTSHFPWVEASDQEPQYDEDGIRWMREATQWNIRLADYRFTWGLNARYTGAPLLRPFGMSYPLDGRHPDDAYLLGPDLLVTPIIHSSDTRSSPIPEGIWLDFWTQEAISGPAEVERTVPLGSQALFLRQGALIPLLDESIETLNPVADEQIRSHAEDSGALIWLVAPGIDHEYINHDGTMASLHEDQLILTPSEEINTYDQFELDLRFDRESSPIESISVNEEMLLWVMNLDEFERCEVCIWGQSLGRVRAKLPPHIEVTQVITWTH